MTSPTPQEAVVSRLREEIRVEVQRALLAELGDTYDCTRVWEAWSYGTMDQDDFVPVLDRLDQLVTGISDPILALPMLLANFRPAVGVREALEPFAAVADEYDDSEDDHFEVWQDAGPQRLIRASFELRHYRRARATLAALTDAPANEAQGGEEVVPTPKPGAYNGSTMQAFEYWFFKELDTETRLSLILLTLGEGPAKEATSYGLQRHCLRAIARRLALTPPTTKGAGE